MNYVVSIVLVLSLLGCQQQMSNDERTAAQEDMKSQEVKKVNKADIYASGLIKGRTIADSAQILLQKHLSTAIQDSGLVKALVYCNTSAYPLIETLANKDIIVRRVSNDWRNPLDAPDDMEALLLDAYNYNIENDQPLEESIQEFDNKYLIYTRPIVASNTLCLQCHGENLSPELRNTIANLYPDDKALNHQLNDLRGMWSIKLPVKDIVKSLD